MTTTYGTISTEPPPPELPFLRRAGEQWIGTRRPWKEMWISLSTPESFNSALARIHSNASYFTVNYAIIILSTLFFSLLWRPMALVVFVVTLAAWLFLYFFRDDPVVVFGYGVQARVILVVLSIFSVALLLLTHAMVFVVGIAVGVGAVLVHGAFRRTDDYAVCDVRDQDGGGGGGRRGERIVDLKETASASYSNNSKSNSSS